MQALRVSEPPARQHLGQRLAEPGSGFSPPTSLPCDRTPGPRQLTRDTLEYTDHRPRPLQRPTSLPKRQQRNLTDLLPRLRATGFPQRLLLKRQTALGEPRDQEEPGAPGRALGQPRTPSFRRKGAPSARPRRHDAPRAPRAGAGSRANSRQAPGSAARSGREGLWSIQQCGRLWARTAGRGPEQPWGGRGQPRGGRALTMLTSETMSMLARSMFIPTQTGGPAGSARHGDQPGWGGRAAGSEDAGRREEPPTRSPPPSATQAAGAEGRAARSGRALPTYPRSPVLGGCRSLSTAYPPSPSQRTCSRGRSRWRGGDRGRESWVRRRLARQRPHASRRPTATLPLGAAHHRHQHWGREEAEKPSSRKAPHPSAAPRHRGGGAPPPSRPAAGAAPAAAAAAAALAPSGGGRRGRGGRGRSAGRRGRGGGWASRGGTALPALPPAPAAAARTWSPAGLLPRSQLLWAPSDRVREGTCSDGGLWQRRRGSTHCSPAPPRARPPPGCGAGQSLCPRDSAPRAPGSPRLTCGARSLGSPGPSRARWPAAEPGARSTWRRSSDLTWVGSAVPRSHDEFQTAKRGSPPLPPPTGFPARPIIQPPAWRPINYSYSI